MTTATASRPLHVSTSALVTITAVIGIGAGLLLGYGLASRTTASSGTSTSVAADNATVDGVLATMATGTAADIEALFVPTFRFTSTSLEPTKNVTTMRIQVTDWQGAGVRPVRVGDVSRVDDVLFVGGRYEMADGTTVAEPFTWTIRLAVDGTRLASIAETFH